MHELYLIYEEIDFGGTTEPKLIGVFFNIKEVDKFVEGLQWGESIVTPDCEILANEVHCIAYDDNGIVITDTALEYKRIIENKGNKEDNN